MAAMYSIGVARQKPPIVWLVPPESAPMSLSVPAVGDVEGTALMPAGHAPGSVDHLTLGSKEDEGP